MSELEGNIQSVSGLDKGWFYLAKSKTAIKFALASGKFRDSFYLEFSSDTTIDGNPCLKLSLIIRDLQIEIRNNATDVSLEFVGLTRGLDPSFDCFIEIKSCEFVNKTELEHPRQVTFVIAGFKTVNFSKNKFLDKISTKLSIGASELSSKEPLDIFKNIFNGGLTFLYNDTLDEGSYRQSIFKGNEISDFLHISINLESKTKLSFSLHNNSIDTLLVSHPVVTVPVRYADELFNSVTENSVGILRYKSLDSDAPGSHVLDIESGNTIEVICFEGKYPLIGSWGKDEKIGGNILKKFKKTGDKEEAKEKVKINNSSFSFLRNRAMNDNRKVLEQMMNYNLTKMDGMLLEIDNWRWQDRSVYWVGKWLSGHGTSWLLPMLWVGAAGFICTAIIASVLEGGIVWKLLLPSVMTCLPLVALRGRIVSFWESRISNSGESLPWIEITLSAAIIVFGASVIWIGGEGTQYRHILLELFHPLGRPSQMFGDSYDAIQGISWGAFTISGALFFFYKAFYAICIYEFIRAARRFTIK